MAAKAAARRSSTSQEPFRVLVIDDDPDLRRLVRSTLEFLAGWDVSVADDGLEGIAAARAITPDVALVDLMLPGMDGYEICWRLSQDDELRGTTLILLTARMQIDRAAVERSNVAGVITKPFDPETLPHQIRACIAASRERSDQ